MQETHLSSKTQNSVMALSKWVLVQAIYRTHSFKIIVQPRDMTMSSQALWPKAWEKTQRHLTLIQSSWNQAQWQQIWANGWIIWCHVSPQKPLEQQSMNWVYSQRHPGLIFTRNWIFKAHGPAMLVYTISICLLGSKLAFVISSRNISSESIKLFNIFYLNRNLL